MFQTTAITYNYIPAGISFNLLFYFTVTILKWILGLPKHHIDRNQNSCQKLLKIYFRNGAAVQVGAYLSVINQDVLDDRVPNGFPINHPHIVHLVPTDLPVLSARHRRPPQYFNRCGVDSLHLDFTRRATGHWENYGIKDKKVKLKEDTSRPTGHLSRESDEADKNLQNGYIPLTSTG